MFTKLVIIFLGFTVIAIRADSKEDKSSEAAPTFQATNNTLVPAETYIVTAVECLKEAYEVYDDDQERASIYAALFQEKYSNGWSVVIGYETFYVHSEIYIEILVGEGGYQGGSKDSKKSKLFLIFADE